ncbi:hypothetical protein BU204_34205, partial [Actinophytocola xanthii]
MDVDGVAGAPQTLRVSRSGHRVRVRQGARRTALSGDVHTIHVLTGTVCPTGRTTERLDRADEVIHNVAVNEAIPVNEVAVNEVAVGDRLTVLRLTRRRAVGDVVQVDDGTVRLAHRDVLVSVLV